MNSSDDIRGRLVLDDRVAAGRIRVQDGHIVAVDLDERGGEAGGAGGRAPPLVTPRVLDGLRVTTIAPELPGALELIGWMHGRGVVVSLGHSGTDLATARAGYAAGARTTTHLFNAMTGVDHRAPGLAVAGLVNDEAFV